MSLQPTPSRISRRYPIGAEVYDGDAAAFRVWAPSRRRVTVVVESDAAAGEFELAREGNGYFSGRRPGTPPGTLYRLRLDDEPRTYPDPASRYQPHGHDGASALVDSERYTWRDAGWRGVGRRGQVIYEMHIGTFTREGTWSAATRELPWLAELGV